MADDPYAKARRRREEERKRKENKRRRQVGEAAGSGRLRDSDAAARRPTRRDLVEDKTRQAAAPLPRGGGLLWRILGSLLSPTVIVLALAGGAYWWVYVRQPEEAPRRDPDLVDVERRALAGEALAQVELGDRYLRGDGVPRDAGKAEELYRAAAEQEHVAAYMALGELTGELKWYREAARRGNAEAKEIVTQRALERLEEKTGAEDQAPGEADEADGP